MGVALELEVWSCQQILCWQRPIQGSNLREVPASWCQIRAALEHRAWGSNPGAIPVSQLLAGRDSSGAWLPGQSLPAHRGSKQLWNSNPSAVLISLSSAGRDHPRALTLGCSLPADCRSGLPQDSSSRADSSYQWSAVVLAFLLSLNKENCCVLPSVSENHNHQAFERFYNNLVIFFKLIKICSNLFFFLCQLMTKRCVQKVDNTGMEQIFKDLKAWKKALLFTYTILPVGTSLHS